MFCIQEATIRSTVKGVAKAQSTNDISLGVAESEAVAIAVTLLGEMLVQRAARRGDYLTLRAGANAAIT